MTDVDVLALALAPTQPVAPMPMTLALARMIAPRVIQPHDRIPPGQCVSWERRCLLCPAGLYRDCMALTLAGLPLRCEPKSAEDVQVLEKMLIEASE